MLKTLNLLLGEQAPLLRRYAWMAALYGVLCGLCTALLLPLMTQLLQAQWRGAGAWLLALLAAVVLAWWWRGRVEQAGVGVGVAVLQTGRHRLGAHVARLPMGWFNAQNTAKVSHLVTQGMMAVAQLPAHVFTPVISGVVAPLVVLALLFVQDWRLGLVGLVALPLLLGVLLLTARMGRWADAAFQHDFAQAGQRMVEFAQAQSVLRAFQGGGQSTRFVAQAMEQQRQSAGRLIAVSALSSVLNVWAVQAVFAALLVAVVIGIDPHSAQVLAPGQVMGTVLSMLLISRFVEPLLELVGYADALRSARGQLDAMDALFAQQPLPQTQQPQWPRDASISLRDVHFSYGADQPAVLRGLNLHVPPGSMTALVGASGSGKSTLVRLMARFWDVDQGEVLIGGTDVRQMDEAQLAAQISQIFQDSYLFAGSMADNIRIGRPGASDAALWEAARQAGVDSIAQRLPGGMDSPVGEGGAQLSGGERQRIAIARALIKDAPILLVDEATAALDTENQALVAHTLARLRGQHTVVVIAHQLSTIAMADQVLVLEGGQVVEQGTPAQLAAQHGRYAQWLAQRAQAQGWRMAAGEERV
ncbi:ABC transporter ATP-binding protein [Comamonas piscis]|uniref:ABC transporter ATP-binding protein n=1 Tax=Comamonas piscis TaxID=1562974 RepID=A0A7G5EEI8_9BURK|nr:ABC transporter ATP-binding protein [Comamonas piscis]QMV72413.1 ABC transporter ATP-binding protein [Comamonas piscis]WSO35181.1 ABC transporter ATP-binding protein [Comamonas piscis]